MTTKPFSALNDRANFYVKALYYAYGHNDLVAAIGNPSFTATMKVDCVAFADAYQKHAENEHVINIQDCFKMYLEGKRVFKRD